MEGANDRIRFSYMKAKKTFTQLCHCASQHTTANGRIFFGILEIIWEGWGWARLRGRGGGEVVRFISRHRSDLFQVTPTGLVGVQPQRHARQTSQTNSLSCADRSHNLCVPVCTARSAVTNKRRGGNMVLCVDKLTNKTLYNLSAYANRQKVYCNP